MDLTIQNAVFDSPDRMRFTATVTMAGWFDGEPFPFTYLCDGSDDVVSPVSAAVGAAWRAGSFEVADDVAPEPAENVAPDLQ